MTDNKCLDNIQSSLGEGGGGGGGLGGERGILEIKGEKG